MKRLIFAVLILVSFSAQAFDPISEETAKKMGFPQGDQCWVQYSYNGYYHFKSPVYVGWETYHTTDLFIVKKGSRYGGSVEFKRVETKNCQENNPILCLDNEKPGHLLGSQINEDETSQIRFAGGNITTIEIDGTKGIEIVLDEFTNSGHFSLGRKKVQELVKVKESCEPREFTLPDNLE